MRRRELGVEAYRLLEAGQGFAHSGCPLFDEVTTPQIQLEGGGIHGRTTMTRSAHDRAALFTDPKLLFQGFRNRRRDLVLNGEDVGKLTIVPLAPQAQAVSRADQLHGNADTRAGTPHCPLEHRCDAKPLRDGSEIAALALECKG